ncbi:phage tail-like protein [Natronocella acetinitrilica]|uniref:Phage tail-like protein n=1 Tax=Natronocella acetinitrilica TaxID=414046 RepID=A0AAE3G7D1_9GAMM|nr:phage tail protein [Natronocella acetinitrilica]MCP1676409.1 phage tail-like protein [Natronocella acetinitrilica]
MSRNDPFAATRFLLEIDGLVPAGFMTCTGLESFTEIIEYREGSDRATLRKLPGLHRHGNIVLSRGVTTSTELADWYRTTLTGQTERRNGAIVLMDDAGEPATRWEFREGWPCRLQGPDLHAMESAVAIETLEICHEGLQRVGGR